MFLTKTGLADLPLPPVPVWGESEGSFGNGVKTAGTETRWALQCK